MWFFLYMIVVSLMMAIIASIIVIKKLFEYVNKNASVQVSEVISYTAFNSVSGFRIPSDKVHLLPISQLLHATLKLREMLKDGDPTSERQTPLPPVFIK